MKKRSSEEYILKFDEEVSQAIKERNKEEERQNRYQLSEIIHTQGFIIASR